MSPLAGLIVVAVLTLMANLPLGFWRFGTRKFSPAWFLAVHSGVPLVVGLRLALGVGLGWKTFPLVAAAYFTGQFLGGRLRQVQRRRGGR